MWLAAGTGRRAGAGGGEPTGQRKNLINRRFSCESRAGVKANGRGPRAANRPE